VKGGNGVALFSIKRASVFDRAPLWGNGMNRARDDGTSRNIVVTK
jgi:hypothetical protein